MVDKEILDILICPRCRGGVKLHHNNNYIICKKCDLAYFINENIPIMLIDKAISINEIDNDINDTDN